MYSFTLKSALCMPSNFPQSLAKFGNFLTICGGTTVAHISLELLEPLGLLPFYCAPSIKTGATSICGRSGAHFARLTPCQPGLTSQSFKEASHMELQMIPVELAPLMTSWWVMGIDRAGNADVAVHILPIFIYSFVQRNGNRTWKLSSLCTRTDRPSPTARCPRVPTCEC